MNGIIRASAVAVAAIMLIMSVCVLKDDSDAATNNYTLEFETGQNVEQDLTEMTDEAILFLYRGSLPDGLRLDIDTVSHEWWGNKYRTYLGGDLIASREPTRSR